MFKSILAKTLYEKRWMMLAWGLGMIITAAITMALYPSFSQLGADEFVNSVPDSLKSLIGSVESFKSIPGYVAQQIYGPQIPIMTIVLAVVLYIGIGVGEEDRGILQTLMAQPITRTSLYLQKFYAGAVVLTIVSVTVAIGVLGGVVALGESISIVRLLQATIMLSLLNVAYGVVAYAIGMGTGKKALAIGVSSAYAFLSFFISSLAPSVKALQPFEKLSVFYYYNAPQPVVAGLDWSNVLVILGFIAVLLGAGLLGFLRRDIDI
jgi:ABC-2 type transport system permease protein